MLLAHAIKYHEARDWIRLQDQSTLTYQSLLNHCKLLEQRCEQYQKAQLKGRAGLTTITTASSVTSSVHQDAVTTHPRKLNCTRCGYNHPKGSCLASGPQCYNCSSIGHYTALCKKPRTHRHNNCPSRPTSRRPSHRYNSKSATRSNSRSPNRGRPYRSPSRSPRCNQCRSPQHYSRKRRSPTLHVHQVSHITHILPRPYAAGQLITDTVSNGHTSFHTTLQIITKQGAKSISVKVDPGADVNIIPLSCYRKLFRKNFTRAGNIKQNVLHLTSNLWSSHDNKPQKFLGYFIINIHHKTISKTLPVRFYIFQDTNSPPILLSYPPSERLGIIEFKEPNEASSPVAVDTITTDKKVTFNNPLIAGKSTKRSSKTPLRSAVRNNPFQDHTPQTVRNKHFQDHQSLQHHKTIENNAFQDQSSQNMSDIFSLKQAFPTSFDTVGNMSGKYTICLDPTVPTVQHTRCKVPIHYKEEIEKTLKEMEQ